jgi:hypothetical protein
MGPLIGCFSVATFTRTCLFWDAVLQVLCPCDGEPCMQAQLCQVLAGCRCRIWSSRIALDHTPPSPHSSPPPARPRRRRRRRSVHDSLSIPLTSAAPSTPFSVAAPVLLPFRPLPRFASSHPQFAPVSHQPLLLYPLLLYPNVQTYMHASGWPRRVGDCSGTRHYSGNRDHHPLQHCGGALVGVSGT